MEDPIDEPAFSNKKKHLWKYPGNAQNYIDANVNGLPQSSCINNGSKEIPSLVLGTSMPDRVKVRHRLNDKNHRPYSDLYF
jgi:hypothetical protein